VTNETGPPFMQSPKFCTLLIKVKTTWKLTNDNPYSDIESKTEKNPR